jgi:thymidylate synthase
LLNDLRKTPDSRRLIVSAWNVADLHRMALPPCHLLYQCYVNNGELSMQVYQRSCDVFLGLPFNIASYAALLSLLAKLTNLKPKKLHFALGDTHLYENHMDQIKLQLSREAKALPRLVIADSVLSFDGLKRDDFKIEGYDPHPAIKGAVAV